MVRKVLFVMLPLAVILFLGGCAPQPVLRPAMSQTVVTVQRYPTNIDANAPMYIYIDGQRAAYTVANGGTASLPVNDGVHTIQVKVGRLESDILNFTAAQRTVSFVASVERESLRKRIVLRRSDVVDDTGIMTEKQMQQQFDPNQ